MNKAVNQLRLFLCTCSGEDDFIIRKCSNAIQLRFALIGFFVLFIFFCCFLSATFFTYSLFQGTKWVSIPMGIIWGSIITNIYLLLLYTISPKLLPVAFKSKNGRTMNSGVKNEKHRFITSSMLFRLALMSLLAIIIAQPLNVVLLSKTVQSSIEKHKIIEKIKMFTTANKTSIENEIIFYKEFNEKIKYQLNEVDSINVSHQISFLNTKVSNDKKFLKESSTLLDSLKKMEESIFLDKKNKAKREEIIDQLNQLYNDEVVSDNQFIIDIEAIIITNLKISSSFNIYKKNLINTINSKTENSIALNNLLNKSNFYIKTIQLLLDENLLSWLSTLAVCLVFILPIYFKFRVRNISESFFDKDYKNNPDMQRLRTEIVSANNFHWLENKIKKISIEDLRTSDYYFKKMIIEYRIILDEYEVSKKNQSQILTKKNADLNKSSLDRINPVLKRLQKYNPDLFNKLHEEIQEEFKNELILKYEYWIDSPFRTKKGNPKSIKNNEADLLQLLYSDNDSLK
ncbi:hypothetical protein FFWV33_12300 [Flavobacterium faecale]|uniref:DUF4407 domain-containing protein n=1 Tax=Flavobacterium faecale TaxID=1355330 RepID=A0A2S1LEP0_9FLAO|nr:DUF4407 domain-containing protein [Flavobacterium faecale]AWG22242.1 hypothetical protein FFWV33_12300 [Flavobacterium faecale]